MLKIGQSHGDMTDLSYVDWQVSPSISPSKCFLATTVGVDLHHENSSKDKSMGYLSPSLYSNGISYDFHNLFF